MANKKKEFITLFDESDTGVDYEVIDKCDINGSTYFAIAPTEYYIIKKISSDKKEDTFVSVEGKELEKAFEVFDRRFNVIDHDND